MKNLFILSIALLSILFVAGQGKYAGGDGDGFSCGAGTFLVGVKAPETTPENHFHMAMSNDLLTVDLETSLFDQIQVIGIKGEILKTVVRMNESKLKIEISDLSPGVYFVRLMARNESIKPITEKFVVLNSQR